MSARERRLERVLEMLNFYGDTLARIPLGNPEDVGSAASQLIVSVLNYRASGVLVEQPGGLAWLGSRGLDRAATAGWLEDFLRAEVRHREQRIGYAIAALPREAPMPDVELVALETLAGLATGALVQTGIREDLERANAALRAQIAERARVERQLAELLAREQAARAAAQAAVRLRDEFLAVASHELNTPITSLLLRVHSLARRAARAPRGAVPAAWTAGLELVRRQAERLAELVGEMLEVSRTSGERAPLEREPVDLAAVARAGVARLEAEGALERSGCTLEIHAEAPVVGRWNRSRLERVVAHLLSNALKYGAGGRVRVAVWDEGPRAAVLAVSDEGIGVAPEDQARIFERFERAVSAERYGGLGLGLYVVRESVAAMGGTIRVDSRPGAGATFTVTLPRAPV